MNALRIAARSPKEVKAAISICASDDRYGTDIHYMGGCLLHESLAWSTLLQAEFCRPPDPVLVGDAWREMWLERLNHERPPMATWLEHQHRDTYWTEEIASENYSGVACPMLVVGGWFDGYVNTALRLMERLDCTRKAIIGPWQHFVPHFDWARPGPAIGFLEESTRWWDRWLKGVDTGVEDDPMVRAWIYDTLPTKPFYKEAPGRWVAEQAWPTDRIAPWILNLSRDRTLTECQGAPATHTVSSPQDTGLLGGLWLPEHDGPDLGLEQSADDGRSLAFESAPLTEAVEILGTPRVRLRLSADVPQAMIVARICDVVSGPGIATRELRYAQSQPQGRQRRAGTAGAGQGLCGRAENEGCRLPLRRGPRHSPGNFDVLLADGVANADVLHALNQERRQLGVAARSSGGGRRARSGVRPAGDAHAGAGHDPPGP